MKRAFQVASLAMATAVACGHTHGDEEVVRNSAQAATTCFSPSQEAPAWVPGKAYATGALVRFEGRLYQCRQGHTSADHWKPTVTPALWHTPTPCGVTAWQTQTSYVTGSIVTSGGETYKCIQGHTSLDGWQPAATSALWQRLPTSSSCTATTVNRVLEQHVEAIDVDDSGGPISFRIDRTLDYATQGFNGFRETGAVRLGTSTEVFSYERTASPSSSAHVTVHWGPIVQGAVNATFDATGNTLTGNIDGRAFLPFSIGSDPATAPFVDGGPSPALHPTLPLADAIKRVEARAARAIETCNVAPAGAVSSTGTMALALNRTQDPGHFTDTYSTLACDGCKASVVATASVTCGFVCFGTFGIGCGGCIATAALAVPSGILACEQSGACCPVSCGDGIGSTCCGGSETCLNGNTGRCCSAGQQTCVGMNCCDSDQSCIDVGPHKGTCCPDGKVCGQNCCGDAQDCVTATGQCCNTGSQCGLACCNNGPLNILTCASDVRSLCCFPDQIDCNGTCCAASLCSNGVCNAPPVPTVQECNARGGDGRICTTDNDCPNSGGAGCVLGCCFTIK